MYSYIYYGDTSHRDLPSFPTRRSSDLARPAKLTTLLWRVRPRRRLASVRDVPSTRTSIVRPTNRWARSRARRWTTSTSRCMRSTFSSWETGSSSSAATVPRRGEKMKDRKSVVEGKGGGGGGGWAG